MHKTYLTAPTRGGHTYHSRNEPLCEYVTLYGFKEETFPIVIKKNIKTNRILGVFSPEGRKFFGVFFAAGEKFRGFPPHNLGGRGGNNLSPPIIWGVGGEKIFRSKSVSPPYGGENKYPWCVSVEAP